MPWDDADDAVVRMFGRYPRDRTHGEQPEHQICPKTNRKYLSPCPTTTYTGGRITFNHIGGNVLRTFMSSTDEHQPLLVRSFDLKKQPPGPRDISRSNRYGILAGVWMATFLSVSSRAVTQSIEY